MSMPNLSRLDASRLRLPLPDRTTTINVLLFIATAVLWGSSAIVSGQQAASGSPEVSVGYRMAIVSAIMFLWCHLSGERLSLRGAERPWIMLQGILFFGLAFISFYYATTILPSGLAAVVLSTSSLFAAIVGWLFLRSAISVRLLIGLVFGIGGLSLVVMPQLLGFDGDGAALGFVWATAAAAATGCGTVISARNSRIGLPIAPVMCWSALAGAIFAFGWAFASDASFAIQVSPGYIGGLLYLAIMASCVTFLMYFTLVRRVGPASASYTLSLVPVVALLISIGFEGLQLDAWILTGGAAIIAGNILVLSGARARSTL
jgi:drug/metabolite transporter (DMT)-like permease